MTGSTISVRDRPRWPVVLATALFLSAAGAALVLRSSAPVLAPGTHDCADIPATVCAGRLAVLASATPDHGVVVAYRLVCTSAQCTPTAGEIRETVVFGDGTVSDGSWDYSQPMGPAPTWPGRTEPPLPVTPVCVNVPDWACLTFAQAALSDMALKGQTITSLTVSCVTTCTPDMGDGRVRVVLSDGRVIETDGYAYGGPGSP